jgi:hypothetical protein
MGRSFGKYQSDQRGGLLFDGTTNGFIVRHHGAGGKGRQSDNASLEAQLRGGGALSGGALSAHVPAEGAKVATRRAPRVRSRTIST